MNDQQRQYVKDFYERKLQGISNLSDFETKEKLEEEYKNKLEDLDKAVIDFFKKEEVKDELKP